MLIIVLASVAEGDPVTATQNILRYRNRMAGYVGYVPWLVYGLVGTT